MREKGSCRSQSGLKPPMKRCIQDGYCQKTGKTKKAQKQKYIIASQKQITILIAVRRKNPKQKKIYNKGKNIEKEEKQDKT